MKQWRVDYRTACGRWLPVGWWGALLPVMTFLREQANDRVRFRIVKEA